MNSRAVIVGGGLAAVVIVAAGLGTFLHGRATADVEAITAAPERARPSLAGLATLLDSRDFKDQALARQRIDELPQAERGAFLALLAHNPKPEVRMLAVAAFARVEDRAPFRSLLSGLADQDPDADVRAAARQVLGGTR